MRCLLILITKIMAAAMPQSSIIKVFTILVRDGGLDSTTTKMTNNKLMHNNSLKRISLHGFAVP